MMDAWSIKFEFTSVSSSSHDFLGRSTYTTPGVRRDMASYDRRRRDGFHEFTGWGVIGALSLCLGLGTRLPLEEPRGCGQWCTFNDRRLFVIDYLSFRSRLLTDIISGTKIRSSDVFPSRAVQRARFSAKLCIEGIIDTQVVCCPVLPDPSRSGIKTVVLS